MSQAFTLTLDGIDYPVTVEDDRIKIHGRAFTAEVTDDGAVLVDGIAHQVAVEGETVTVDGEEYELSIEGLHASVEVGAEKATPSTEAETVAGAGAVLAIMPGKVINVLVEEGDTVDEGQPVCVLEAMKMENELNAPTAGVVEALHVSVGDDVEKGQVLVEIE